MSLLLPPHVKALLISLAVTQLLLVGNVAIHVYLIEVNKVHQYRRETDKVQPLCTHSGTNGDLIYLMVDGVTYIYCLDGAKHAYFMKLMEHTPGKALNYIKAEAWWCEKE